MNQRILRKRLLEAPKMEPVDAVKLVYQSEFGCGHLLAEEEICAARIAQEIESVAADVNAPALVEIGGGLCRLDLRAPQVRAIQPRTLARMMTLTSDRVRGGVHGFEGKLVMLRQLCQEGLAPFSPEALGTYLAGYEKEGYPPVSHSQAYRQAYAPAYRVVLRGFGDGLAALQRLEEELLQKGRALMAVDGDCGAGKTTLVNLLVPLFRGSAIRMDDFFLPSVLRTSQRLAQPGGNVHYERFQEEVLGPLAHEKPFSYARYDCATGESLPRQVHTAPVIFIEGSYSHHPFFEEDYRKLGVVKVFLSVEEEEQLRRLERRNPTLLPRFQREWIPLEKNYAKAYHIQEKADLLIRSQTWEEDQP